jgi:hypothetical protein
MLTLTVDQRSRVDDLLRDNGVQQYKVLLLVASGAVLRARAGDAGQRVSAHDEQVEKGDIVRVDDKKALYQQKLATLGADEFRDYVFSADIDPYFRAMAELVQFRGDTVQLVSNHNTFAGFVKALLNDPMVTHPVRHLFVISHSNEEGFLFTDLDEKSKRNSVLGSLGGRVRKAPPIDYDQLASLKGELSIDPSSVSPRPPVSAAVRQLRRDFTPKVLQPYLKGDQVYVHIRGCGIGKNKTYMSKLKEVLGGKVTVTAPFFFHAVDSVQSPSGRIEYFLYLFRVTSPTRYRSRASLLRAFQTATFADLDGKLIERTLWDQWLVPQANMHEPEREWNSPPVVSPVDGRRTRVKGHYWYRDRHLFGDEVFMDIPRTANTREKQKAFAIDAVRKWEIMQPSHPYPAYRRAGYETVDDFVRGVTWNVNAINGGKFKVIMERHEYTLAPPVVEKGTQRLYLNFFPTPPRGSGRPAAPIISIPEADPRFFGVY